MIMLIADTAPLQDLHLKPYVEIRERFERRTDRDFNGRADDNRSDLLSRFRVGATFQKSRLSGQLEYQFAHDWAWSQSANLSARNSDASLANLTYANGGSSLTAGRYKLALGSQRLIGPLEWSNVPRSFDGLHVDSGKWLAYAFKLGVARPMPRDARVAGASYVERSYQVNAILKHNEVVGGDEDIVTINPWFHRPYGAWNVDLEGALQYGDFGARKQEAWALHGQVGYAVDAKTGLYVVANAASGGGDSDTRRTFDTLYPTAHNLYGLADMVGWQNSREISFGVTHRPRPNLSLRAAYHRFWLADAKDAWYNALGVPNGRVGGVFVDPTGRSGRDLGSEIDLEATYGFRKNITFSGGVAAFSPGSFVRRVSGDDRTQVFGYLQAQFRF
ncbi:hypothetical protein EON82_02310 [bacterium]|nr:MAG: hypothetical protein EON82_02310 [bacterium]